MSRTNSVYQILKAIDISFKNQDFNFERDLDLKKLKISDYRRELIIESLVDFGFVEGITVSYDMYRDSYINIKDPRLTSAGTNYLEKNSSMKKSYAALKE